MEDISIDIDIEIDQIQPHKGKKIDRIIVSQHIENYMIIPSYAVTYSETDSSIVGWYIEESRRQPDMCFRLSNDHYIYEFVLNQRLLIFRYYEREFYTYKVGQKIIDLNRGQYLRLKDPEKGVSLEPYSMGFLPNGDLVLISLDDKIYLYSYKNKPTTNKFLWEHSHVYDTKTEILDKRNIQFYVHQTKLFIFDGLQLIQWNLLTMTFEMQYNLVNESYISNLVMNKDGTLLALDINGKIDILSMETGAWISKYDSVDPNNPDGTNKTGNVPVEFVISKDGSEGLIIYHEGGYKLADPFHPEDAIDITNEITNDINNHENIIITKSNKKFCIIENNVWVTDGLREDTFQKVLSTSYHNIYTLSIFKTIRSMLIDIIDNKVKPEVDDIESKDELADREPKYNKKLANGEPFQFNIQLSGNNISFNGVTKSHTTNNEFHRYMLSYKQLNNRDLALITIQGIYIYTIVDDFLRLRYFWNNKEWNDCYKKLKDDDKMKERYEEIIKEIIKILADEFKYSRSSLPPPNFITIFEKYSQKVDEYKELVLNIINDPIEFSKFGSKMLEIAIDKKNDSIIHEILDKIVDKIKDESTNENLEIKDQTNDIKLLSIISLNLPELHSNLVMKYILHTSIILDPTVKNVKNSTNTSLNAYSKDVHISSSNNYFKFLMSPYEAFKDFISYLKIKEIQEVISFIVPFPQICKYQEENYNSWNKMLYKPKPILFCNIDSNGFYQWWNFAAIIDFKWKTFGKKYYFLIWFFYVIFYICFALATLDQNFIIYIYRKILFIISILLGLIHLSFEIRQFLWDPIIYLNDLWNFFDIGAYLLPIITSIYWLISGSLHLQFAAFSILLLSFKFLLLFRVFQFYGVYFAIMIGVARKVFPFLIVVLFIAIFGFACAFFILLSPTDTNMFNWFPTSILAMYLFLTGDSGSLSSSDYREAHTLTILLVLFTLSTVIYLMNLFIGLLNIAIEDYNKYEESLVIKAQFIMEIELFYMLPYQRCKKKWFPDWIYYDIPIDEVRKLVNAIDENRTEFNTPPFTPFISKKLRKLIEIPEPINEKKLIEELYKNKQVKGELRKMKDELSQIKNELCQAKDELRQTEDELWQAKNKLKQLTKDKQEFE